MFRPFGVGFPYFFATILGDQPAVQGRYSNVCLKNAPSRPHTTACRLRNSWILPRRPPGLMVEFWQQYLKEGAPQVFLGGFFYISYSGCKTYLITMGIVSFRYEFRIRLLHLTSTEWFIESMALLEGLNARCWPLDQTRIQPQILHSGKHQEHLNALPLRLFFRFLRLNG